MNDEITAGRARGRRWLHGAAILAIMVSIALLTAACGNGGASAAPGASPSPESTYAKLLAYARCMRSHGVPDFPDPSSNGGFDINGNKINIHSGQVQAARKACQGLLPNVGQSGQSQAQNAAKALKFARCMRSHGLPDFPDPSSNGSFHMSASSGINPKSATFQKAQHACQSIMSGQGEISISGQAGG